MERNRSDWQEGRWFSYSAMGQGPAEPLHDASWESTNPDPGVSSYVVTPFCLDTY